MTRLSWPPHTLLAPSVPRAPAEPTAATLKATLGVGWDHGLRGSEVPSHDGVREGASRKAGQAAWHQLLNRLRGLGSS